MKIFTAKVTICLLLTLTYSSLYSYPKLRLSPKKVRLRDYIGKWYEIARLPTFLLKGCRCPTSYYIKKSNHFYVINRCIKYGEPSRLDIKSYILPNTKNKKIRNVYWPFSADLHVLFIDKSYKYAVTGSQNREYLWFISRRPYVSKSMFRKMLKVAKLNGFDTSKLIINDFKCPRNY